MAEFSLNVPTEAETADALEGLMDILRLDELAEIDLPPYLTRLLLQLEELLTEVTAVPEPLRAAARNEPAASGSLGG